MTECDEVAGGLLATRFPQPLTMDTARVYVRERMPDESVTVVDNVAEALWRASVRPITLRDHPCNMCPDAIMVSGWHDPGTIFRCRHGHVAALPQGSAALPGLFVTKEAAREAIADYWGGVRGDEQGCERSRFGGRHMVAGGRLGLGRERPEAGRRAPADRGRLGYGEDARGDGGGELCAVAAPACPGGRDEHGDARAGAGPDLCNRSGFAARCGSPAAGADAET